MIQAPATISKIITMADKSLRLYVDTQELAPEDAGLIFGLYQKFGQFVFAEAGDDVKEKDINVPAYAKIEKSDKTPSQRLRGVLWHAYQENDKLKMQYKTADDFYRVKMEEIINHFKTKD